ncbi:MAG: hypothetical protein N3D83_13475, partial [Pyrobaculum aerophilum]|nr:hypothetical protein [Pyrobaculum aerophilum]
MKTLLDFLKEGAEDRVESVETRASGRPCKRVKLPEAFELPRRFGVSWGCLTQGAFRGIDAVVAEGGAKGVRFRYVLPYDAEMGYYATYKRREEHEEKSDRLPQYFADALYELAAKYQIELTRDIYVLVNGAEVDKTVCYQKRSAE